MPDTELSPYQKEIVDIARKRDAERVFMKDRLSEIHDQIRELSRRIDESIQRSMHFLGRAGVFVCPRCKRVTDHTFANSDSKVPSCKECR